MFLVDTLKCLLVHTLEYLPVDTLECLLADTLECLFLNTFRRNERAHQITSMTDIVAGFYCRVRLWILSLNIKLGVVLGFQLSVHSL
jgi:hypothetical protein